jgi:hypothetical protein
MFKDKADRQDRQRDPQRRARKAAARTSERVT